MAVRPRIAVLFRYPIHVHEDLNNIFPNVLRQLGETADIHYISYRSTKHHPLRAAGKIHFHELPLRINRQSLADKWIKTLLWIALMPWIGLWCRFNRIDLIYLEESMPLPGWLLSLFSGKPTVISGADMFWDVVFSGKGIGKPIKQFLWRFERFCWLRLDGVISRTGALRDQLILMGFRPDRIHVVTEATESHIFFPMPRNEARDALHIPAEEFVVAHHGLIQANKALDRIIEFMRPLASKYPHLKLLIAGDGPERPRLEKLCDEWKLNGMVRFLGWLPGTKGLNELLSACDVSLVNREGRFSDHFQVTANLLHSLSCGCTTLAARLRGIAEIVEDGKNGFLFDPGNGDEFRSKLEVLIQDSELRKRLADGALQTARTRLAPETVTTAWLNALQALLLDTRRESR